MGATFYICEPDRSTVLDRLVDEMEAEDPLEDVEDSAYDRFGAELEAHHLDACSLSEDDSAPAQAFYEWFHDKITHDLDKLYLMPTEAKRALDTLEKQLEKHGRDRLVQGFWHPGDEYTAEAAGRYLEQVREALRRAVQLNGLMAICYR